LVLDAGRVDLQHDAGFGGVVLVEGQGRRELREGARTVVTIMCFTENAAVLWFGSASSVIGAAVRKAARKSVM